MTWETRCVKVGRAQIRLLVADGGHESWLVLWPGICMAAEQFIPFLVTGRGHSVNVVAIDPPGHGLSDPWKVNEMTEQDVKEIWQAIIHELHINRAVIGGHSYGACAALMGEAPLMEEVTAILLLDGGYSDPTDRTGDELRSEIRQYIETTCFPDWESFLDEERSHVRSWSDAIEASCKATMKENEQGQLVLRADVNSAGHGYVLSNRFEPSTAPNTSKSASSWPPNLWIGWSPRGSVLPGYQRG